MTAAEPGDVAGRSTSVTRPAAARAGLDSASAERDAEAAVTALYAAHYRSLVGLAVLLVPDAVTAEEVVQDSFVALHRGWRGLRDGGSDLELSYLRRSVLNRCRSVLRHPLPPDRPGADQSPSAMVAASAVVAALHGLPLRQREALVLQHFAGLSAAQAARMMGIGTSAVQRHTARAMASLHGLLEHEA